MNNICLRKYAQNDGIAGRGKEEEDDCSGRCR